ncbi:MAG: peptide deformylase [Candidatus Marinimicrobia bacterium]|nr:peptide deformylase [Candidatus Neomarinimicrobiota bacterium]MBL7109693.1 peptide deformylase [Candidatus Neomarinimicrobiota bacterium]
MALLPLQKYGSSLLRRKTKEVIEFSNLQPLLNDMLETMYQEEGIGLAANQVGINQSLFVVDVSNIEDETDTKPRIFINPKIIDREGSVDIEEGCLSVPEIRAVITRAENITIEYLDVKQKKQTDQYSGMLARVIQHEYDHLQGKYFTDYLSLTKKSMIQKRLVEILQKGIPSKSITIK